MENNYQTFDLAVILSRSIAISHQIVAGDINPINDRSLTQLQEQGLHENTLPPELSDRDAKNKTKQKQ